MRKRTLALTAAAAVVLLIPATAGAITLFWPFFVNDFFAGSGTVTGIKMNSPTSFEAKHFDVAFQLSDGTAHYSGGAFCTANALNEVQLDLLTQAAVNGVPLIVTGTSPRPGVNCVSSIIAEP